MGLNNYRFYVLQNNTYWCKTQLKVRIKIRYLNVHDTNDKQFNAPTLGVLNR